MVDGGIGLDTRLGSDSEKFQAIKYIVVIECIACLTPLCDWDRQYLLLLEPGEGVVVAGGFGVTGPIRQRAVRRHLIGLDINVSCEASLTRNR
jgi:hypothetical protein